MPSKTSTNPHSPTHFPLNYIQRQDVRDVVVMRTLAATIHIESVNELSSDHSPVLLVMDLKSRECTLPRMD
jgi:hypothetical protein